MAEVYLYGDIGDWHGATGAESFRRKLAEVGPEEPISLYINSMGGSVFEAVAMVSLLGRHKGKITVHIDAIAASAASVVMLAGDEIIMPENTMVMIHNPWSIAIGDHRDMAKSAEVLETIRDSMVGVYTAKTGKSEEELKALLDGETWMTAKEAVEHGFADRVTEALPKAKVEEALAKFDLSSFKNVPGTVAAMASAGRHIIAARAAGTGGSMPKEKQEAPQQEAPQQEAAAVDVEKIRADIQKEFEARLSSASELCAAVGLDGDKALEIATSAKSIEDVQAAVIDAVAARQKDNRVSSANASVTVTEDSADKFKAAAVSAIMMRSGVEAHDTKNEIRRMSLMRLAEESIIRAGGRPDGDQRRMVQQAMGIVAHGGHSRSDFPNILQDVVHKRLLKGYEEAAETWQKWVRIGSLRDFRKTQLVSLTIFDDLEKVNENGEYTYGTIGDRGEEIQLAKYGRMFRVSYETIVDDDLRLLTAIPALMGRAAARMPGDLVYAILTGNPTLSDGVPLFDADHNNTDNAALSYDSLFERRTAMMTQKIATSDGKLRTVGIRPEFLIVPPELSGAAFQILNAEFEDSNLQPNRVRNAFKVIEEPRLSDDSNAGFYLAANGNTADTIEVAFRDGISAPQLDSKEAWEVDALEYKVRFEVAAAPVDYRGLQRGGKS